MAHITNIREGMIKVQLGVTKPKKPELPKDFLEKLLRAAAEDACTARTYSCDVLNKFENEHGCEVSDVSYRGGVLHLRINEKYSYNFRVHLEEIEDE